MRLSKHARRGAARRESHWVIRIGARVALALACTPPLSVTQITRRNATKRAAQFAPNVAQKASRHPTAWVRMALTRRGAIVVGCWVNLGASRGCATRCERAKPRTQRQRMLPQQRALKKWAERDLRSLQAPPKALRGECRAWIGEAETPPLAS